MKNFFNTRLMNALSSEGADVGSVSSSSSSGSDFNMNDDHALEKSGSDAVRELGLDPSKYFGQDDQDEDTEEVSHESDETQEAGQATDENAYLEWVNNLGAVHNDSPVKVESIEEVKNALQMYKDYTVKTQSLSEERKAWDSEKSQATEEINAAINEFNGARQAYEKQFQELEQWTFTLNQLKESAPDLHEEITRAYEGTVKQFSNPVLDKQLASIRAELEETKKGLSSRENQLIIDKFDSEKGALSATEQSMKELGVAVDWNEVKKEWAKTGLPVKQVLGMVYFDQMTKAQASKSKVQTTKQKVAARPVGASSGSRPGAKVSAIDPKLNSYDYAKQLLNKHKQS